MSVETRESAPRIERAGEILGRVRDEVGRVLVGQRNMVDRLLVGLLTGGHVLLEGMPGLAKTLAVKSLADALALKFRRIQFTPDLLPADLTGTLIYNPRDGSFTAKRGPLFAHLVLADEINRAPAKVQSALLEAMQEMQVTHAGTSRPLPQPFCVLATQNPIELEGTYPLPEAQLDRFMFKLRVPYPDSASLRTLLDVSLDAEPANSLPAVLEPSDVPAIAALCRSVLVAERCKQAAIALVLATQPSISRDDTSARQHIRYGASPRALQSLIRAARVRAVMSGRSHLDVDDLAAVALPTLRHRVLLRLESELEGLDADTVLAGLVDQWRRES